MKKRPHEDILSKVDISDDDVLQAMKEIPGYLDITPGDFKDLYRVAYRQALQRIVTSVRAKDIMTKDVLTVKRDAPLKEVASLMALKGVAGVPVVDGEGRVEGVISEKDFLARMGGKDSRSFMGVVAECLKGKGCVAVSVRAQKASDIMSTPAFVVQKDDTLMEIAEILHDRRINRVPVVDRNGKLAGIVSRADVVRASRRKGR